MARILPLYIIAGFIAVALSVLVVLLLTRDAVAQESQPSPLHCVDSNGNGVIDISELFDVIDAYFGSSPIIHPTPAATPEPSPTPTHGSRGNPVPLDTAFEVRNSETDHWEVTVLETTPDATNLVLNENQFNDPPEDGNQFFIAKVRAKYLGTDSANFNGRLRLGALGDGGVLYTTSGNSCGVIPDGLPNNELFTNGTIEGNVCWEILSTDAESLLMVFGEAFLHSTDNRFWFDLTE